MARWWDTDMASASQALYVDPSMALDVASTPDDAFTANVLRYTQEQQDQDRATVEQDRSGFLGTIAGWYSDADEFLSGVPLVRGVWGTTKNVAQAVWYPVDKLASGAHWLYSEGVSQPLSTVILQYGKAATGSGEFFDWQELTESYGSAEHVSPGQAIANVALTEAAQSDEGLLGLIYDPEELLPEDMRGETNKRAYERLLYDSEYWRSKVGWTYTAGTGATDFALVMAADPSTYLTLGAASIVKGARSVQLATKGDEVVRTRGAITDTARKLVGKKPETVEEVAKGEKMQEFFDWVAAPGKNGNRKTAAEIAEHPIWGRGRRKNPFASQYSQVLSNWERGNMEMGFRFMAGDNSAVAPLMQSGRKVLDDIGRISENRVLVDSTRLDPEVIGYMASVQARRPTIMPASGLAMSHEERLVHAEVAIDQYTRLGVTDASAVDVAAAQSWKESKLDLLNEEIVALQGEEKILRDMLGANLGKDSQDFSTVAANGFGGLQSAYRMGSGSFTSSYKDAEQAFNNKMRDRRGRTTTEGYRKGFFGTPIRVVNAFNDRVPQGFVNHNDPDAGERVFEVLREVPALGAEKRQQLLDRYMTAGDKVAKSRALQAINYEIIHHMAVNVKGLDGEVARIISGMVETKTQETVNKLLNRGGKTYSTKSQAYSGARAEEGGRTVDYVEDGEGWIVAPLLKTQLDQTDALIPVREIERALDRTSGAMQRIRQSGGSAADSVKVVADSMNGIWKAATLLRPAYIVRSTSDELAAAAIKFGFMSRIIADGGVGMKNFVLNRGQRGGALLGLTSHTPTTGGGIEASIVKINDQDAIRAMQSRRKEMQKQLAKETDPLKKAQLKSDLEQFKVNRIRVSGALPVVNARIAMERELADNVQVEINKLVARRDKIINGLSNPQSTIGGGPGSPGWTRSSNAVARLDNQIYRLESKIMDHEAALKEFRDYHDEIYRTALASAGRRLGEGEFEVAGVGRIPQAFSGQWDHPIARDQISSDAASASIFARAESIDTTRMINQGSWTTIAPDAPNHMESWTNALNRQIAQDELALRIMEDPTGVKASKWLKTPNGKEHLADLGIRARDPDQLIRDISLMLDKYAPAHTDLRTKMLAGDEIVEADIVAQIPKAEFPTVHGEEILDRLAFSAKDSPANIIDRIIEKGFKRLGSIPSDVLSRHPTYLKFQEGRFKELAQTELSYRASIGKTDSLTPGDLQKILEKSDQLARKDMSKIVYDPNRTTASEALRFITPFFSAHADSLARWGGLIAEKPQTLSTLAKIYNAPVAANMVTDEYGNLVDKSGYADVFDPSTGEKVGREFVPIEKRVMHFKMPWKQGSKSEGTYPIKIQSMNTILPGDPWFNPGTGPFAQVTGSQIAKAVPQAGDFLQWAKILPYGPTDTSQAITPKYIRAIYDAWRADDPDNEEYQKAYLAIWNKKQMEYHQSEGKAKFSQKDIEREAKEFLNLNILEAWGSPAQASNTPLTGTPYQFFVDQLGKMRKLDPENYRDKFLAKFGTDYAGFTAGLTKSIGVAATISADRQAELFRDEIAADPDMAQFWVGDIHNGGPFSQSVYQKQLDDNFGAVKGRERITAEQAIENAQTQAGWWEYRTAIGAIDSALIRNGFKSYTQKGAENYLAAKKQVTAGIAAAYPAWENAFMNVDRGKIKQRIRSFELSLGSEKLRNDPLRYEMPALAKYLQGRRDFKEILTRNGFEKLSYDVSGQPTGRSKAIGRAWDQFKMGLINENVAFGDLYNRYLTNDELQ